MKIRINNIEFREYIINNGDNKYSVRYNVKEDSYSVRLISLNVSHWDRNSMGYVGITQDFFNELKNVINNSK